METSWNCSSVLNCWFHKEPARQVQLLILCAQKFCPCATKHWSNKIVHVWSFIQTTQDWLFAAWRLSKRFFKQKHKFKSGLTTWLVSNKTYKHDTLCYLVNTWCWPYWISWSSTYPSGWACPATSPPFAWAPVGVNLEPWEHNEEKIRETKS